ASYAVGARIGQGEERDLQRVERRRVPLALAVGRTGRLLPDPARGAAGDVDRLGDGREGAPVGFDGRSLRPLPDTVRADRELAVRGLHAELRRGDAPEHDQDPPGWLRGLHRHSSELPATAYQVARDANYSVTGSARTD